MNGRDPYRVRDLLARLSGRDLAILEDVERFRLLSTAHVRRLRFATNHVSTLAATRGAVRVLRRLESLGLLVRLQRRVGGSQRGSSASVWQLGATGERLLRFRRGERGRRRFEEPSHGFTDHRLAVSELAVRVAEEARARGFEVLALEAEPGSWRPFQTPAGLTWLKPDLAVVTADQVSETHAWVEVDRATEHLPAVVRQCRLYQRYFASGAEQAHRGLFPAVVWSVPDPRRAQAIEKAIRRDSALDPDLFIVRPVQDVLEVLVPPDG